MKKSIFNLLLLSVITVGCNNELTTNPYKSEPEIRNLKLPLNTIKPIVETQNTAKQQTIKSPLPENKDVKINENKKLNVEELYAPIIYFDSQEKNPLTSVDKFLEMGVKLEAHRTGRKNPLLAKKVTVEELAKYQTEKIKIDGNDYPLMLQTDDKVTEYDPVVYIHKIKLEGYTYIQYWFFYSYNETSSVNKLEIVEKCGDHQGDWEHISLKINTEKFNNALTDDEYFKAIDSVYFSQHSVKDNVSRKFKSPGDKDLHFDGTHVKAYVARGTHATYSEQSTGEGYLLRKIATTSLFDKADGKGTVLHSSGHLTDLDSQEWNMFAGHWGKISNDICNIVEWLSDASNDGPVGAYYHQPYYDKTDWFKPKN